MTTACAFCVTCMPDSLRNQNGKEREHCPAKEAEWCPGELLRRLFGCTPGLPSRFARPQDLRGVVVCPAVSYVLSKGFFSCFCMT